MKTDYYFSRLKNLKFVSERSYRGAYLVIGSWLRLFKIGESGGTQLERWMSVRDAALATFSAEYIVQNLPIVSRSLRGLPEFTRGTHCFDGEEFVWRMPNSGQSRKTNQPIASVWLGALLDPDFDFLRPNAFSKTTAPVVSHPASLNSRRGLTNLLHSLPRKTMRKWPKTP